MSDIKKINGVVLADIAKVNGLALQDYTLLLLHCNGIDASQILTDSSSSNHTITVYNTAQIDTAMADAFGNNNGVLMLDGNSDYLTAPDSSDWDCYSSASSKHTICFFIKHTNTSPTSNEMYLSHRSATTERWHVYRNGSMGLNLQCRTSGTSVLDVSSSNNILTDTNWHHICLIKISNKHALYLDGNQVAYTEDSDTVDINGLLYIGQRGNNGSYVQGYMHEIILINENIFNANPNADLTDTISVPTNQLNFINIKKINSVSNI